MLKVSVSVVDFEQIYISCVCTKNNKEKFAYFKTLNCFRSPGKTLPPTKSTGKLLKSEKSTNALVIYHDR